MRSRPIPQIPLASATEYAWQAHINGSDAAELHGDCSSPIDRALRGVGSIVLSNLAQLAANDNWDYLGRYGYTWVPGKEPDFRPPKTRTITVRVRCRKCPECLRHKRRLWTARGIDEVRTSMRTWFGTLTVSPERRFQAKLMADKREALRGNGSLSSLTSVERTRAIASVLNPEVTRWLKRVRKQSGANLRYLLVCEPHKDGFPHFHLLLHERGQPVTKRVLESQWTYGHSHWRLVPTGEVAQVGYVCKYITKSAQTRIRASRHYGQPQAVNGVLTTR